MNLINNFKTAYQKSLKKVKAKELKNDKLKQAILKYHDAKTDLKDKKKARNKIKTWMIFHNFLYMAKMILAALVILFVGYQPYAMASDYIDTATSIPWKHITNGELISLQIHAQGRYMLAAVIFGVALLTVIKLPWNKAPYHHVSIEEFVETQYPKIKKEAQQLNK